MKKILIGGAGGAPSEGVIKSLLKSKKGEQIIGMGSDETDLVLSSAQKKYAIPYANSSKYLESLIKILEKEKPDLVHFQNDLEIFYASQYRESIHATGTKTFMPDHDVIDTCVHKFKTYLKLKAANIKVPENLMINNEEDLKKAFSDLCDKEGKIWLRASSIGGGGKGALPTNNFSFAKGWIERFNGWGDFVAAEMLTPNTVTWLSIWFEGELIVAQTRIRKGWTHGNRTVSGVTGVTKIGQTYSDNMVDDIAIRTVKAVSEKPHGIFGVDMAYDKDGIPNPTEINISRFFTTVLFFTEAGLNLPEIFKDLILFNEKPKLEKIINPLPDGLMWLRGMDTHPKIFLPEQIKEQIIYIS
jgi:carbamoyl-phosphate synthase large subunit